MTTPWLLVTLPLSLLALLGPVVSFQNVQEVAFSHHHYRHRHRHRHRYHSMEHLWTARSSTTTTTTTTERFSITTLTPKSSYESTDTNAYTAYTNTNINAGNSVGVVGLSRQQMVVHSLRWFGLAVGVVSSGGGAAQAAKFPEMDVNNMLGREYTAFPGLYPTVASKLVLGAKNEPYKSKKDVYAALDGNEAMIERLKQYDGSIVIRPLDKNVRQFKESQICKYECGSRVSDSYRDRQIQSVQTDRR